MFAPPDGRPLGLTGKLAAGSATGLIKCLASYPLELARTRLAADTTLKGQPRMYTGIVHCILHTLQHEGTRGLYKGMVASTAAVVPYLAISFTAYDELQSRLPDNTDVRSAWWYGVSKLGSGAAAGLVASTLVYPIDTVRRRMQVCPEPVSPPDTAAFETCVMLMCTSGMRCRSVGRQPIAFSIKDIGTAYAACQGGKVLVLSIGALALTHCA